MKTRTLLWIEILLVGLTLGLLVGVAACAAEVAPPVTPATTSASNGVHGDVMIDLRAKPIPQEIVDKLSPEQVFELYQMEIQKAQGGVKSIPALAAVITGIVFACPVLVVAVVMIFRLRRQAMLHKTLDAMIEKGVPIPPELLAHEQPRRPSDLRRGIVLVATGFGVAAFLILDKDKAWGLGLIPLLIGIGYLIVWKLDQRKQAC